MKREEIFSAVQEIFADVFDDESITICDTTTSSDIDDWDSFEQINLIVNIEKRFNIKFDISQVEQMKNVGEMVDIIQKKVQ